MLSSSSVRAISDALDDDDDDEDDDELIDDENEDEADAVDIDDEKMEGDNDGRAAWEIKLVNSAGTVGDRSGEATDDKSNDAWRRFSPRKKKRLCSGSFDLIL
jgi:hypothetical protein